MSKHCKLETIGMYTSMLCAVHCFVMPLILVSYPVFSWIRFSRSFDLIMISVSAIVGLTSTLLHLKRHRECTSLWFLLGGLTLIVLSRLMTLSPFVTTILVLAGPMFMFVSFWMNQHQETAQ